MVIPTVNGVSRFNINIRTKFDNSFVMTFLERDAVTGNLSGRDISNSEFFAQARDPEDSSLAFDFATGFVNLGTDGKLRVSVDKATANLQTIGKDLCFDVKENTGTEEVPQGQGLVHVNEGITD